MNKRVVGVRPFLLYHRSGFPSPQPQLFDQELLVLGRDWQATSCGAREMGKAQAMVRTGGEDFSAVQWRPFFFAAAPRKLVQAPKRVPFFSGSLNN